MIEQRKFLKVLRKRSGESKNNFAVDVKAINICRGLSILLYLWLSDSFSSKPRKVITAKEEVQCFIAYQLIGYKSWKADIIVAKTKSDKRVIKLDSANPATGIWKVDFTIDFSGARTNSDNEISACDFDFTIAISCGKGTGKIETEWLSSRLPSKTKLKIIVENVLNS